MLKMMTSETTTIPCECGTKDASWHGDAMRVYCCEACWRHEQIRQMHINPLFMPKRPKRNAPLEKKQE